MPLLDSIKSVIGGDEDTFTYECRECGRVFEGTTPSSSKASCPDCGADRVKSAPQKSPDA